MSGIAKRGERMNQEMDNRLRLLANIIWILGARYSEQQKLSEIRKVVTGKKLLTATEETRLGEFLNKIKETRKYC
jgi:hypothetical protein